MVGPHPGAQVVTGPDPNRNVAREVVLTRLRAALGPDPHVPDIPRDYQPARYLDADGTVARFAERVDEYRANVHRADPAGLPDTLARILAASSATRVGVPAGLDPTWLHTLPDALEVIRDTSATSTSLLDTLDVVITGAATGIADTGTIILDASPNQGRRALTLVPDHHICVIRTRDIVQTVSQGLARTDPTRPLTLISGPSATSDIELDRVEGVHGPRTLDVIIVNLEPA